MANIFEQYRNDATDPRFTVGDPREAGAFKKKARLLAALLVPPFRFLPTILSLSLVCRGGLKLSLSESTDPPFLALSVALS
jgi:hypothetical protein